jgi:hypothetical protein
VHEVEAWLLITCSSTQQVITPVDHLSMVQRVPRVAMENSYCMVVEVRLVGALGQISQVFPIVGVQITILGMVLRPRRQKIEVLACRSHRDSRLSRIIWTVHVYEDMPDMGRARGINWW